MDKNPNWWKTLTNMQRILYAELYRKSFYEFFKEFWDTFDPNPFVDGILVQFYCETFQYCCRSWVKTEPVNVALPEEYKHCRVIDARNNKRNVNINVPPRHSKSAVFNVAGPVWLWLTYPIKAASCSHTADLARSMNTKRQKILNSDKFKFFFGDSVILKGNSNGLLVDSRGGELYSKARDAMTGFGCDLAIIDDATNAEQAKRDKEEMANAWSFFQTTLPSRINDPNTGVIINIQQRLAPNDITGHILNDPKLAATYFFIVLPAIFEEDTVLICPISGDMFFFKKNDTLWAERFGDYSILIEQVGESVFQTQYLQKPIASDRTIVKPRMIVEKSKVDVPDISQADTVYASHDFPVKDKETSDFLGSVVAYKVGSRIYITSCLETKMAFVDSIEYVTSLDTIYPGIIQIVEDKANGSPIIQALRGRLSGVQAFDPGTKSKTQRLENATLYMNSGDVVFVKDKFNDETKLYELSEDLANLKDKLLSFPFVEHDDIIDAFSQLIAFVFGDRQFMVYGRSFNEFNMTTDLGEPNLYTTIFFNKDGDIWKVCEIAVKFGEETRMIVRREWMFKGSTEEGLRNLKKFAPNQNVFIDCSFIPSFYGTYKKDLLIEPYETTDFESSVNALNMALAKNLVLINSECRAIVADIESFKYDKRRDDAFVFKTQNDGFVACLRTAMQYYSVGE